VTPTDSAPFPEPRENPSGATIERFWRQHAGLVYDAARRVTGNPSDAEDVVQTVFLRLARRPAADLASLGAGYFRRAAVHAALDVLRSRQRAGWVPLEHVAETAAAGTPADDLRRSRLRQALRLALSRLAPRSAEIVALRFFEGLDNPQIGQLLGVSTPLVAVLLHRGRARLRKDLSTLLGDSR
jgi:RNA polymerase sigma-70 factor (ECF subfamily)